MQGNRAATGWSRLLVMAGLTIAICGWRGPASVQAQEFRHSYALVVGIDHYDGGWPRLSKAIEDARAVKDGLERLGFEVELLTDSTTRELQSALLEFFVIKGSDPDARLLLWFAGHGETIDGEGFLVPRDAPVSAKPDFLLKAIPMRVVGSFVRLAQARHVLAIFDSCFAGTIFESRGGVARSWPGREQEPVRQFLTSGDAGQRVRDDGSFREYFLRALTGSAEADFNRDGKVTGSELGMYMSQQISGLTRSAQTPRYGKLHDVRFNRGDFIFAVGAPAPPPVAGLDKDGLFWQSIKWSNRASEYRAYLQAFPNGTYAGLARARLADMLPGPAAAAPQVVSMLDETMRVTGGTAATVRVGPDLDTAALDRLAPGSPVQVTGKLHGIPWYRVRLDDGRSGYLLAAYLASASASPRPPAAMPAKVLHIAFGEPISEAVVIEVAPGASQIRRRLDFRNGAIGWFHGDASEQALRFSIHIDSPRRTRSPAFRYSFEPDGRLSVVLENVGSNNGAWWGVAEDDYERLTAAVDLSVLR